MQLQQLRPGLEINQLQVRVSSDGADAYAFRCIYRGTEMMYHTVHHTS